jgi:hypothetical protein
MSVSEEYLMLVQTGLIVRCSDEKLGNLSASQRAAYAIIFLAEAIKESEKVKDPLREAHEFLENCFSDYKRGRRTLSYPAGESRSSL